MVLTIRQNLDVPKARPVETDDSCSVSRRTLESKVFLVTDCANSPLAVVLPL